MPIITLEETKSLLKISDAAQDTLIEQLIPLVQRLIIVYCRNHFINYNFQYESTDIYFEADSEGGLIKLNNENDSLLNRGFTVGSDISVIGSLENDGIYSIKSVEDKIITVNELNIINENYNEHVMLSRVQFPTDLKLDAATIINYFLEQKSQLVQSESLPGGYSVTYKEQPQLFMSLNRYRKVY